MSGLPQGASLNKGTEVGTGTWVLAEGDLSGLMMDLPPSVSDDFQLQIVSEADDLSGNAIFVDEDVVTVDVVAWMASQQDNSNTTPDPIPTPDPKAPSTPLGVGEIVVVGLENNTSDSAPSDFKTFGHVFVKGDLPAGKSLVAIIDGLEYEVQVDVKATHDDGSAKHAILTMVTPALPSGASVDAILKLNDTGPSGATLSTADVFANNYDLQVKIDLDVGTGTQTYNIDAATWLQKAISEGRVETWIDGPFATEFSFSEKLPGHDHLELRFDVRVYANGEIRTDVAVASESTYVGGIETYQYAATITEGGEIVFQDMDIAHHRNANWHTQVWSNGEPAAFVTFDVGYMAETGAIPHYDTTLGVRSATIEKTNENALLEAGPMGSAGVQESMSTTGARADISVLPKWTAQYLVSQSEMAFDTMLLKGDAGGSVPWHFIDEATGTYVSLDDHPDLRIDSRFTTGPEAIADPYVDIKTATGWKPDLAHQPSLSYIPYLVTGDRYHLQNQLAQASFNMANVVAGSRNQTDGFLVIDRDVAAQVRSSAWTLRTLIDTAFIVPDGHQLEAYFEGNAEFNIDYLFKKYITDGHFNSIGEIEGFLDTNKIKDGSGTIGPWQQDFVVSVLGMAAERGNDNAAALVEWATNFTAGRFINGEAGFDPAFGAGYYYQLKDPTSGEFVKSWSELFDINYAGEPDPAKGIEGSPNSPGGYAAYAKMAMASIINTTGSVDAVEAYGFLMGKTHIKDVYSGTNRDGYWGDPSFFLMPQFSDGSYLTVDQVFVDNSFTGSIGNELLYGTINADVIKGNGGIDWIFGDAGNDVLQGGSGDDLLFGGEGNDSITGGGGSDTMKGNAGSDVFIFGSGDSGFDTISDFAIGVDSLQISSDLIADAGGSISALLSSAYSHENGIVLELGNLKIYLEEIEFANLNQIDIGIGG